MGKASSTLSGVETLEAELEALATAYEREWITVQSLEKDLDAFLKDYFARVGKAFEALAGAQPSPAASTRACRRPAAEADNAQIKTLYRSLVRELHPDAGGSTDTHRLFSEVVTAYKQRSLPRLQQLYYRAMARHIKRRNIRQVMLHGYKKEMEEAVTQMRDYRNYLESSPEYRLMQKDFHARLKGINLVDKVLEQARLQLHRHYRQALSS